MQNLKNKLFLPVIAMFMLSGCMTTYLRNMNTQLKTIDTDKISAIGQIKSKNQVVIIGNKYVYLLKDDELNRIISSIPNGNYEISKQDIDVRVYPTNNSASSQNCFYIYDNGKIENGKRKTHQFCHVIMEVYKRNNDISAEYVIKSDININIKSTDSGKAFASSALTPFAFVGDIVLLPAHLIMFEHLEH